jgi:hypothetical protein
LELIAKLRHSCSASAVIGVIALCVLWCMVAFAAWLSRPDKRADNDDDYVESQPGPGSPSHRKSPPGEHHELLGVHPDDGREEIIDALEGEARDGETWYDAINVPPDATRREIVEALRREFERLEDAVDDEIGDLVHQAYNRPNRRL